MTMPAHIAQAIKAGQFTYCDEGMLSNYGETARKGRYVEFFLDEHGDVHPFKGLPTGREKGQRFALIVVPIGDDEEVESHERATKDVADHEKGDGEKQCTPFHELPRTMQAVLACKDERFQQYLGATDEREAAKCVYLLCGVESRRDLNTADGGAAKWDGLYGDYELSTGRRAERHG